MEKEDLLLRATSSPPLLTKNSEMTFGEWDNNYIIMYNALVDLSKSSYILDYNAATTYDINVNNYSVYLDQLWKWINAAPEANITPGSIGSELKWEKVYASDLVHKRDQDTKLDEGGANEVSAAQLKALVDGGGLTTLTIEIGEWNMDTTESKVVAHTLSNTEWKTVRSIQVIISNDAGTAHYKLESLIGGSTSPAGGVSVIQNSNLTLVRKTSNLFDQNIFDSVGGFNRGWVTLEYTPD